MFVNYEDNILHDQNIAMKNSSQKKKKFIQKCIFVSGFITNLVLLKNK
jgi:hypothetical protein